MYDLNKRAYFTNLGELRMLLADMPDVTEVCITGAMGAYRHVNDDAYSISLDDDSLIYCYPELDDEKVCEDNENREYTEHDQRIKQIFGISEAAFVVDGTTTLTLNTPHTKL